MIKKIFNATAPNNVLSRNSFDTANTIYVFETEYTLNNNIFVIPIPANCILEFQGGRIINGALAGNNTKIVAGTTSVFSNVTCSGTWLNSYADIRWFGVKSQNSGVDNTAAFKYGLNSGWKSIYIPEGVFKIATEIQINKSGISIWGAGKEKTRIESAKGKSIFVLAASEITISSIYFKSEARGYPEDEDTDIHHSDVNSGVFANAGKTDITIKSCDFDGFTMGIYFYQGNRNVIVSECAFRNMKYLPKDATKPAENGAGGYGILFKHVLEQNLVGTDNYLVEKCVFENTVYRHAIYSQSSNGIITNNVFYGKSGVPTDYVTLFECRIQVMGTNNLIISNNIFDNGIYAIDLFEGTTQMPVNENVLICNNTFRNFKLVRYSNSIIKLSNVVSADITNNSMCFNKSTAIVIGAKVSNVNIANNIIKTLPNPDPNPELYSHGIVAHYATSSCNNINIHDNMIEVPSEGECCPIFFNLDEDFGNVYIKNNILKNGKIGIWIKPMDSNKTVVLNNSNIQFNIGRLLNTLVKIDTVTYHVINNNNTI